MGEKMDSPNKGFDFFQKVARSGESFTLEELAETTGWSMQSVNTYRSKQWKEFLEKSLDGKWYVRPEFLRLTRAEFLNHITQNRPLFTRYERTVHPSVLIFEFLIPLTRETELRSALDALFFKDTLRQRIREVGVTGLTKLVPREDGEEDPAYLDRAIEFANRFYATRSSTYLDVFALRVNCSTASRRRNT